MYHYKIGDFECNEGDEVRTCYGIGTVLDPEKACEMEPDCSNNPTKWVYVNLGKSFSSSGVVGLVPKIHNVLVITPGLHVSQSQEDTCKKCGGPGERFPMCCKCKNCGEVIWGI